MSTVKGVRLMVGHSHFIPADCPKAGSDFSRTKPQKHHAGQFENLEFVM